MLGVAGNIKTRQINGEQIDSEINKWMEQNQKAIVLDIKFTASATSEYWSNDALIIYREEK